MVLLVLAVMVPWLLLLLLLMLLLLLLVRRGGCGRGCMRLIPLATPGTRRRWWYGWWLVLAVVVERHCKCGSELSTSGCEVIPKPKAGGGIQAQ